MGKMIGKRLLQTVVVLIVSSIIIFVMVRLSGVDPVSVILGGKETSEETRMRVISSFGLDKSYVEQYLNWVGGFFKGKLGMSFKYQTDVSNLLAGRAITTLGLVFMSSIIALVIAIPLGVFCGVKKDTAIDKVFNIFILILNGCPAFFTSILLVIIISAAAPNYPLIGSYNSVGEYFVRLSVPSIALAFTMLALAMRVVRSNIIEQMNSPYTMTAVAKGCSTVHLVLHHNLKNAIIPVISVVSIQIGSMVAGAVLVENVFSLNGLGTLLVSSIQNSDYAVTQSITMLLIILFLVISTIADILYAIIDPRIRVE